MVLPENKRPYFIEMKTIFSKDVLIKGQPSNISYIDEKFLLELEYFSINAKDIWDSSKNGDTYYVYNNNTGYIDNVYVVTGTPGEVVPGTEDDEEDILESNRYFNLIDNYAYTNPIGKTLCFFDSDMNLKSSWSILSDGNNKFLGRFDGTMFSAGNIQTANNIVDIIRNYHSGKNTITESMLNELANINIRRDSSESYYLIPVIIFILKEYID
jgi:hypothetical protein